MWQLGKQKMIAEVQGGGWGSSGVGERWVGWGQKSEVEPAGVAGDGFPVACASSFPCDPVKLELPGRRPRGGHGRHVGAQV